MKHHQLICSGFLCYVLPCSNLFCSLLSLTLFWSGLFCSVLFFLVPPSVLMYSGFTKNVSRQESFTNTSPQYVSKPSIVLKTPVASPRSRKRLCLALCLHSRMRDKTVEVQELDPMLLPSNRTRIPTLPYHILTSKDRMRLLLHPRGSWA